MPNNEPRFYRKLKYVYEETATISVIYNQYYKGTRPMSLAHLKKHIEMLNNCRAQIEDIIATLEKEAE